MRYDQRAQSVIRDDASGVADDVGIPLFQSQGARRKTRVHASQDSQLALGTRSQSAQLMGARVNFVGGENFVNNGHSSKSLAKRRCVSLAGIGRGVSRRGEKKNSYHAECEL